MHEYHSTATQTHKYKLTQQHRHISTDARVSDTRTRLQQHRHISTDTWVGDMSTLLPTQIQIHESSKHGDISTRLHIHTLTDTCMSNHPSKTHQAHVNTIKHAIWTVCDTAYRDKQTHAIWKVCQTQHNDKFTPCVLSGGDVVSKFPADLELKKSWNQSWIQPLENYFGAPEIPSLSCSWLCLVSALHRKPSGMTTWM